MASLSETTGQAKRNWPGQVQGWVDRRKPVAELRCLALEALPQIAKWLVGDRDHRLAGLIVEEQHTEWEFRYLFYREGQPGWVHTITRLPLEKKSLPSVTTTVHAADWHEREIEDLFGIAFEGHPLLGDFILHNELWQEALAPMRRAFDPAAAIAERKPDTEWRPRRIVQDPGAFAMPVGPIFSGTAESVLFFLETVGEDVVRAFPRLFYKFRGIEKLAEGKTIDECLLLAERFAATTAFAHAWAFCQAVEAICRIRVPKRAQALRVLLAELERFRHHVGVVHEICESTGLAVAASQAAILEEDLLRVCGSLAGHRYLFGLAVPGGLSQDLNDAGCVAAIEACQRILGEFLKLYEMLRYSSSFLDRLEGVGIVSPPNAREHGLVGPVARASGLSDDLRKAQPYGGYENFWFSAPVGIDGDGLERLGIFVGEAAQSVEILKQIPAMLEAGKVFAPVTVQPGAALGWCEAPRGAAFHWLRLGSGGRVERFRLITPSFVNWHGFHLAAEKFAFQDFPIILATFGLSVAENDR